MLKVVEKLRRCAKHQSAGFFVNLEQAFGLTRYTCGTTVKPSGDDILSAIADEIDQEVSENYMRLPVAADGFPVKVGEYVQFLDADCSSGMRVVSLIDGKSFQVEDQPTPVLAPSVRHVKSRTLDDVLRELVGQRFDWGTFNLGLSDDDSKLANTTHNSEIIAKYEKEIREICDRDAARTRD